MIKNVGFHNIFSDIAKFVIKNLDVIFFCCVGVQKRGIKVTYFVPLLPFIPILITILQGIDGNIGTK